MKYVYEDDILNNYFYSKILPKESLNVGGHRKIKVLIIILFQQGEQQSERTQQRN